MHLTKLKSSTYLHQQSQRASTPAALGDQTEAFQAIRVKVPVRRRQEDLKADGNGLSSLIAPGLETRLQNNESIKLT